MCGTLIMIRLAVSVESAVAAWPAPMLATSRNASSRAVVATLATGDVPANRVVFFADGVRLAAVMGCELRAWQLTPGR